MTTKLATLVENDLWMYPTLCLIVIAGQGDESYFARFLLRFCQQSADHDDTEHAGMLVREVVQSASLLVDLPPRPPGASDER